MILVSVRKKKNINKQHSYISCRVKCVGKNISFYTIHQK